MVAFGHTAVGAAVGLLTYNSLASANPVGGLVVSAGMGIISHYIVDFIPHGHFIQFSDFKNKIIIVILFDLLSSILLFLALIYLNFGTGLKFLYILFCIGGSHLPDVIDGLIYTGFLKARGIVGIENSFHLAVHWHGAKEKGLKLSLWDLWQLSVVILSLALIIMN